MYWPLLLALAGDTSQCTCAGDAADSDWSAATACAASAIEHVRVDSALTASTGLRGVAAREDHTGRHWDLRTYTEPTSGRRLYPYVFAKTLAHDERTGFSDADDVDTLLRAIRCMSREALDGIRLFDGVDGANAPLRVRKLTGVPTGYSYNLMGCAVQTPHLYHLYPIDSAASAFEMAEVYAMSLLRDVRFTDFGTDATVLAVIDALNAYTDKTTAPTDATGAITPATLFRGVGTGETVGPYISQFLLSAFHNGNMRNVEQRYVGEEDPDNALTFASWRDQQNGGRTPAISFTAPSLVHTPRVLGAIVHNDPVNQFFQQAYLVAKSNGIAPNEYGHPATSAWTSGGEPDVLAALAHVALPALRTAWHQKWALTLRIRPEVFAQRVELASADAQLHDAVPGLAAILAEMAVSPALLELVRADNERRGANRTLLLAGQFPEGAPTHPSHPSGHAVIAGACVTVLKAMLRTHDGEGDAAAPLKWVAGARTARVPSADGQSLVAYTAADAADMTIIGELNKLASNIAIGRNWAGVHYRGDADGGIAAGEEYAIAYLEDKLREAREDEMGVKGAELGGGWTLSKFDGTVVTITQPSTDGSSGGIGAGTATSASDDDGNGGGGSKDAAKTAKSGVVLEPGTWVQEYLYVLVLGPVVLVLAALVGWLQLVRPRLVARAAVASVAGASAAAKRGTKAQASTPWRDTLRDIDRGAQERDGAKVAPTAEHDAGGEDRRPRRRSRAESGARHASAPVEVTAVAITSAGGERRAESASWWPW
ncbi:hypothetical protein KFE25_004178 [Diacronema lutheri]|uniref:Phosphatidic acid phosphatase type 2/haloperoxidase domain-containing protein n=1 Tax=Diacronema lutheri TaxID=2081491 RepID=A0A8J5X790_DIALT|nr:hypothetical protein KFE25_004178 [Diacronema lutheri]